MTTVKCVVVGDDGVGKTSLLNSFIMNILRCNYARTLFDSYTPTIMVGEVPYILGLFDTNSDDGYDRLRPLTYPQTDIFLLCFSIASPASFENVKGRWFPEVHQHCPGVPYLVVGIQADLREDPQGERLARKLGAAKYVECSALTQKGLKNVFDEAIMATLEPPRVKEKYLGCIVV